MFEHVFVQTDDSRVRSEKGPLFGFFPPGFRFIITTTNPHGNVQTPTALEPLYRASVFLKSCALETVYN